LRCGAKRFGGAAARLPWIAAYGRPRTDSTTAFLAHALEVMARSDRRDIDLADVSRAVPQPARKQRRHDGHLRHWYWVTERRRWLRVVTEPDGETVHNAFSDRDFEP
jgi:hypothetical protein